MLGLNLKGLGIPNRILKSNRVMKALTGMKKEEFLGQVKRLEEVIKEEEEGKKDRKRRPGGGRKHTLSGAGEKLFYILFYLKCYPTYDVAGFIFGVDRSQACRWVHMLLSLLEKALGKEKVLPCRQVHSVEEVMMLLANSGVRDLFIDGTERPIQRPGKYETQKEHYSGKKKRHTKKNIVVSDENRRVLMLTETKPGSEHDYRMVKEENILSNIPEGVGIWVDLGFQGIEKDNPQLAVVIPHKKPRGGELTEEQKAENRIIAGIRIIVEHTMAGIKRLKAVIDPYRNHKADVDDKFMVLGCGIWNYHRKLASE